MKKENQPELMTGERTQRRETEASGKAGIQQDYWTLKKEGGQEVILKPHMGLSSHKSVVELDHCTDPPGSSFTRSRSDPACDWLEAFPNF